MNIRIRRTIREAKSKWYQENCDKIKEPSAHNFNRHKKVRVDTHVQMNRENILLNKNGKIIIENK